MFPLVQKSARAALIQSDGEKKNPPLWMQKKKNYSSQDKKKQIQKGIMLI